MPFAEDNFIQSRRHSAHHYTARIVILHKITA
jgi:hypothetical protein